jgi:hypothetical protein
MTLWSEDSGIFAAVLPSLNCDLALPLKDRSRIRNGSVRAEATVMRCAAYGGTAVTLRNIGKT